MKPIFFLLFILSFLQLKSQTANEQLINEGVQLHDRGEFEAAIEKYDAVLKTEPANEAARYEKSYSLMELKKYHEAAALLQDLLKNSKNPQYRKQAYVNYGTILDFQQQGKQSLEVYNKGIKEFPDFYLLHFNKGITQISLAATADAVKSFQQALVCNPLHPSSHNALARIKANTERIPAVLSLLTFLLIETKGTRTEQNVALLDQLFLKGITKSENGNTNIAIDASLLDKKNKQKEDDFSTAEMMLSLLGASDKVADTLGAKTDADRLDYKLQLLIGMIDETSKKEKGFYKNFYVPLFIEMKQKGYTRTASYIVYAASGKPGVNEWLDNNKTAIDDFYGWFKSYQWNKGK